MKKMRKLIPAFAMLMVAAVMMSTASFAWFSMGTKANATGMQVTATASSSLIISTSPLLADMASANQNVTLSAATTDLKPATHDDSFTSKLGRPNSEQNIDAATGQMLTGNTLVEAGTGYYWDYTVYLATVGGAALEDKDLYAYITVPATLANYIHNAVTIDFWVGAITDGSTTTAPAYFADSETNFLTVTQTGTAGGTAVAPTKTLKVKIADAIDIPLLVENEGDESASSIIVTMRVYFDGALNDGTSGNTYVRNVYASATGANFSVEFSAE